MESDVNTLKERFKQLEADKRVIEKKIVNLKFTIKSLERG